MKPERFTVWTSRRGHDVTLNTFTVRSAALAYARRVSRRGETVYVDRTEPTCEPIATYMGGLSIKV